MLPPRILALLVILLAVQGLCKPTKSIEDKDYEDDPPDDDEDTLDEDKDEDVDTSDTPPQILSVAKSIRVKAGSTVLLPCQVINAENHAITWMKDDAYLFFGEQHIENNKRIVNLSNNSLVIYNASVNDSSDNYTCTILGEKNLFITHRLLVDPDRTQQSVPLQHSHKGTIRVMPSRQVEVTQGHSIKLGCETDIQPPPEIKWFIENKKVDSVYDPDVSIDGNYLMIKKVNRSHSGRYQCLAEDGSKMPAMEAITVIVYYTPEIEVKKNVVHSGTGIESEMTCIVSAYPEAIITWYKGDKEITQKESILLYHGPTKGNKIKYVLKIKHTSPRDFGNYECRAQNSIGQETKSITLTGVPSQPKPTGAEMTQDDTAIILKWRLESYSPIIEYKLQYHRLGDEWNFLEPEVKDGKGNQFTVEYPIGDLQPGSYEAILKARNAFGWSPLSVPHKFNGDSPPEMARKEGNAAAVQIRPPGVLLALILVVLSCAFPSL